MYCKYSDGAAVTLTQARHVPSASQELTVYHLPQTDRNGAIPLGLTWQEWTLTGVIADTLSVRWRDITQISLDNTSWRACVYRGIDFTRVLEGQSQYELRLLVAPALEGALVRYPTTGYKWGDQSITGISQAGNTPALPTIVYLAPLFYAHLSADLYDFAGDAITFARAAAKLHAGISYAINASIYDNGLFISSETSQDVPKWTPVASTLKSIAMQIKQTAYPKAWVIGAGAAPNLLTANQSNAETDTTGVTSVAGTLTRNTVTPLVGTGDFKCVATGGTMTLKTTTTAVAVTAGQWYAAQVLIKTSGCAAGRKNRLTIAWFTAGDVLISGSDSADIDCPTVATVMSVVGLAPATATKAYIYVYIISAVASETLYADSLMLESIPTLLTVWTATLNKLTIDTVNNLLKWTDDTTTVSATFPTASYMGGAVTDIVVVDGTSHAVTVIAHAAAGTWYTQTGTLALIAYPELTLGNLEGSIANLIEYPYALISTEWEALDFSLEPLRFNDLLIGNHYAETITKQSDGRLETAAGIDISGLLGGSDIPIAASSVTIAQTAGLSARWYVEVRRTDV
jgi:hypothetical protein